MTACGPIQSTQVLVDADAELAAARRVNAQQEAPYEYELAAAYQQKAKEESARARYQTAVGYAQRALTCAEAAVRVATETPPPPGAAACEPPYPLSDPNAADPVTTSTVSTATTAPGGPR